MGTYDDITQAESSGQSKVPNPHSSALGLGQFVNGTWLDMIRRYRPDLAQGKSRDEILKLREDPDLSQKMTAAYAKENEENLRRAGLPVSPGSTYLMHFAGPSGAVALMKADPNTPVESILSSSALKANPYLQGKTAGWVIGWANKRMADEATARSNMAPQPAPSNEKPTIPYLAQTQAVDPALDATNWLQRPNSPNVLRPDATPPFAPSAGVPRVASTPFVGGR